MWLPRCSAAAAAGSALQVFLASVLLLPGAVDSRLLAPRPPALLASRSARTTGVPTSYVANGCWRTSKIRNEARCGKSVDTVHQCFECCKEHEGVSYFGIEEGSTCWCGSGYDGRELEQRACDMPCESSKKLGCGGVLATNVYVTYDCSYGPGNFSALGDGECKKADGTISRHEWYEGLDLDACKAKCEQTKDCTGISTQVSNQGDPNTCAIYTEGPVSASANATHSRLCYGFARGPVVDEVAEKMEGVYLTRFTSFPNTTCGQASGNKLDIDGSETHFGSVDECKLACWQGKGSMQCQGFTYEQNVTKCTFHRDVLHGGLAKQSMTECYFKKT